MSFKTFSRIDKVKSAPKGFEKKFLNFIKTESKKHSFEDFSIYQKVFSQFHEKNFSSTVPLPQHPKIVMKKHQRRSSYMSYGISRSPLIEHQKKYKMSSSRSSPPEFETKKKTLPIMLNTTRRNGKRKKSQKVKKSEKKKLFDKKRDHSINSLLITKNICDYSYDKVKHITKENEMLKGKVNELLKRIRVIQRLNGGKKKCKSVKYQQLLILERNRNLQLTKRLEKVENELKSNRMRKDDDTSVFKQLFNVQRDLIIETLEVACEKNFTLKQVLGILHFIAGDFESLGSNIEKKNVSILVHEIDKIRKKLSRYIIHNQNVVKGVANSVSDSGDCNSSIGNGNNGDNVIKSGKKREFRKKIRVRSRKKSESRRNSNKLGEEFLNQLRISRVNDKKRSHCLIFRNDEKEVMDQIFQ